MTLLLGFPMLPEKRIEPCLPEVSVGRERIHHPSVSHHDERNAIHEPPFLVRVPLV